MEVVISKNEQGYGREGIRYIDSTHKECSSCSEVKPHKDFHKDKNNIRGKGLAYYCKVCANKKGKVFHETKNKSNPDYKNQVRKQYLKRTFGITEEEFLLRLNQQNGKCLICGVGLLEIGTHTHIDHDHKTNKIRGILCTNCNRGLGHFKDNILNLRMAISYLEKHNINVADIKEVLGC